MNPSEAQDAARTQSAGDTLCDIFYFMDIVQIYVADFLVCVILGLDPRIQVVGVVRHRRTLSLLSALCVLLSEYQAVVRRADKTNQLKRI